MRPAGGPGHDRDVERGGRRPCPLVLDLEPDIQVVDVEVEDLLLLVDGDLAGFLREPELLELSGRVDGLDEIPKIQIHALIVWHKYSWGCTSKALTI